MCGCPQGPVRMLKPGQRANVWLELVMPEVNGDVFQVWRKDYFSTACTAEWVQHVSPS